MATFWITFVLVAMYPPCLAGTNTEQQVQECTVGEYTIANALTVHHALVLFIIFSQHAYIAKTSVALTLCS